MTETPDVKQAVEALGQAVQDFTGTWAERLAAQSQRLDCLETAFSRGERKTQTATESDWSRQSKAFRSWAQNGDDTELKALSVGLDPEGGYLVSPEMSGQIVQRLFETSPIRTLATVVETRRDAIEFLLDKDEAGAEWITETAARGETANPRLAKLRISVFELHAQIKSTQQLLDDADFAVESWLAAKAADKFARTESTAFVLGNGVGQPRGLLDYATASSDDDVRPWGTVQYVASGAAGGFPTLGSGADNPAALFNMVYSLKAAYRAGARGLMNKATVNLVRKMRDSGGQFLWQPGLEAGQPDRLLGYPIVEAEDLPDVAANALAIAFGNFKVAYTVVDRIGQRVLRDPFTAKPFVLFDFTKRVGGDVVNTEAYKILKIAVS